MNNINLRTVAQSVLPDTGTITAVFDHNAIGTLLPKSVKTYTFLAPLSLVNNVHRGDFVVVNSTKGLAVVQVAAVSQSTDDLDLDSSFQYRWAFQKVNVPVALALDKRDESHHQTLLAKRRMAVRHQILTEALGMTEFQLRLALASSDIEADDDG